MNQARGQKPYIGVTGVVTKPEAVALWELAHSVGFGSKDTHELMVGVLVSSKTMNGVAVPNKRYPIIADVANIVNTCVEYAFTTVHYNTQQKEDLSGQLESVLEIAPEIHGFQLNIRKPDISEMQKIKGKRPQIKLILQVNFSSLVSLYKEATPEAAALYVAQYGEVADYALLDLSGGRGTLVDTNWAQEALERIGSDRRSAQVKIGLAGGFGAGPDTELVLAPLVKQTGTNFSIDAESKVRRPARDALPNERYQDDLDLDKTKQYLFKAKEILAGQIPDLLGERSNSRKA